MIIIDKHEKNSLVISELVEHGINIEIKHLKVADYIIGDVAIERKTVSDFISSMINKRLIRQLEEIKQYPKQLLILEGLEAKELYNDENINGIHANSIRGFILAILSKFNVPIIFTKNYKDTANYLILIEKRNNGVAKEPSLNAKKKARNVCEQQQFILEGFPGIGPSTAKTLLKEYKTIKNIFDAPIAQLKEKIGKKADIFKILDEIYSS